MKLNYLILIQNYYCWREINMTLQELYDKYKKMLPEKDLSDDDFDVYDASGGNIDDAYSLGYDAGIVSATEDFLNDQMEEIGYYDGKRHKTIRNVPKVLS